MSVFTLAVWQKLLFVSTGPPTRTSTQVRHASILLDNTDKGNAHLKGRFIDEGTLFGTGVLSLSLSLSLSGVVNLSDIVNASLTHRGHARLPFALLSTTTDNHEHLLNITSNVLSVDNPCYVSLQFSREYKIIALFLARATVFRQFINHILEAIHKKTDSWNHP